jgi:uncharacterized YccA/Bax inhibitor family protein
MAFFESNNPALNEKTFQKSIEIYDADAVKMTERGTLNKFFLLTLLVIATASITWNAFFQQKDVSLWMIGGGIGGFIVALILIFNPSKAAFLAPVYALLEGFFVGGASAMYNSRFDKIAPGIVFQAVVITFGTVIAMFLLYRFQIIKVTDKFRSMVFTATLGLVFFYGIAFVLRLFHINIPFLHEGSTIGILFSLFVIGLASMNLIMNFDRIEQGVAMGAPKYMEWYGAFGLIVVIIWLYLEILQLLAKMNSRRN